MKRAWKTSELRWGLAWVAALFVARKYGLTPRVFTILLTILCSLYILGRGIYKRYRTQPMGELTSEFVIFLSVAGYIGFECLVRKLTSADLACSCITALVGCWFISRSLAKEMRPPAQLIR